MSAESGKRFNPYPAYKDSGVEWLGKIPAHWETMRLKFAVRILGGGTPAKANLDYWAGDIPWVSPKDMKAGVVQDTEDHITVAALQESATQLIPAGSVLLVVRSGILRHSIPVAVSGLEVAVNQDMKGLVPRGFVSATYLKYLIDGNQTSFLMAWRKEGATVESIEIDLLLTTRIPIPSFDEQQVIGDLLDRETAKIDALVAKKERLIELLQEKRTALITQAVTKGLHPNVPMKDSGVEWLGEIPAHWNVIKAKWIFGLFSGFAFKGDYFSKENTQAPILVTPGNFAVDGGLYFNDQNTTRYTEEYSDDFLLRKGDLITVLTDLSYKNLILGRIEFVNDDGQLLNQRVAKIMISGGCSEITNRNYIRYLMNTQLYRDQLIAYTTGATVNHTSPTKFCDRFCLIPPLDEQERIVDKLKLEEEHTRALIAKIRHVIEKLKEYRTAVISAAVTGKIDVREEVA